MENETSTRTFLNDIHQRGFWIGQSVLVLAALMVLLMGQIAIASGDRFLGVVFSMLAVGIFMLPAMHFWVIPRIRYQITQAAVQIRPGWLFVSQGTIPLESIGSVVPVEGFIVPNFSSSGLRLNFKKTNGKPTFLVISPKDRNRFLRELDRATPHLMLQEDRLIRAAVVHYVN